LAQEFVESDVDLIFSREIQLKIEQPRDRLLTGE